MKTKIFAAILALASNVAFAGPVSNGNFSTGNLSGWTKNSGSVTVQNNGSFNYADLFAGLGNGVATTLSQTVHLSAGDVLSGYAQFFAHDYMPYNDNAFVSINGYNLFASSVSVVGNYGTSALTQFNYLVGVSGNYLLSAGVANNGDNGLASELRVSNFAVQSASAAIPEPASVALIGLGLLGVAVMRRRAANGNKA
jgi:hypothetical protein